MPESEPGTILHLNTERGWRGGERQTLWLATRLDARGVRSVVAARPDGPLYGRAREQGLEVLPVAPTFEADPLAVLRLRRSLARERIPLLHAHAAHAVGLGALATLGTGTVLVASRRVVTPPRRNPGTRWKYGRAAVIVAVSEAVRRSLVTAGFAEARLAVVPSGIDLDRVVTAAGAQLLASLGVRSGPPLVVMVAALTAEKAPGTFLAAVADARARGVDLQA